VTALGILPRYGTGQGMLAHNLTVYPFSAAMQH